MTSVACTVRVCTLLREVGLVVIEPASLPGGVRRQMAERAIGRESGLTVVG